MSFDYPDNVSFACCKCGLCCGDTETKMRHVLLLKHDVERIAKYVGREIKAFTVDIIGRTPYIYEMQKSKSGKCIFLKDNKCTIYEARPLICRFYPFELSTNDEGIYVFRTTEECPGVHVQNTQGKGKKLDLDFFMILLNLARVEFESG